MQRKLKNEKKMSLKKLKLGVTLGTGTFSNVRQVFYKNHKKTSFALKIMKKETIIKLKQVDHIYSEKNILALINHPFLIKYIRLFQDTHNLYFLFEYI